MSTYAETRTDAWNRRAALAGEVDFTMMYIAHDAFNRDIARLIAAADGGMGLSAAALTTWRGFARQLHIHHAAEDKALWPHLAAAVTDPAESRILQDMETEHASLDPRIDQIQAAIVASDAVAMVSELKTLGQGLAAHMIHEETEALPLVERRLGKAGWDTFTLEIRQQQGIRGAAEYLPWVLEGASDQIQATLMRMLPPPVRLLYRRMWEPKYRKANRLG